MLYVTQQELGVLNMLMGFREKYRARPNLKYESKVALIQIFHHIYAHTLTRTLTRNIAYSKLKCAAFHLQQKCCTLQNIIKVSSKHNLKSSGCSMMGSYFAFLVICRRVKHQELQRKSMALFIPSKGWNTPTQHRLGEYQPKWEQSMLNLCCKYIQSHPSVSFC